jgi:hypothetical protein
MSALEKLIGAMAQSDKAEIYNGFVEKYNTDAAAQEAMDTGDPDLLQCVLVAFTVDAIRKAAQAAGASRSDAKSSAARANGRKGGRPRKNVDDEGASR